MAVTQSKSERSTHDKVYRVKVTGRHAITLPAEICRALDIQVGDYLELEVKDDAVTLQPVPSVPIAELRGILKSYFPNSESIRTFLEEERSGWDERDERLDEIWEGKWPPSNRSDD